MNKFLQLIKDVYERFFKKNPLSKKTTVKFESESPRIKRVNRILEVVSVSDFNKFLTANDGFKKKLKSDCKRVNFKWFDPTMFIMNLGIQDDPIPMNLTPDCLHTDLDYTALTTWLDHENKPMKNKFASLQLFRTEGHKFFRSMPFNPYPVILKVIFFDEKANSASGSTHAVFYTPNKRYSRRWLIVHKGENFNPIFLDKKEHGARGGKWNQAEPDEDISRKIQIGIGLQFLATNYWHVDIGEKDLPKMRIPVNCKRLSSLFKIREIPEGSSRRKALIHWVSQHERKLQKDECEKLVSVVKHFRGETEFKWGGMDCEIMPSEEDAKHMAEPLSLKSLQIKDTIENGKTCAIEK